MELARPDNKENGLRPATFMSDAVIISLITGFVTIIGIGLTGYVNIRLGKIHKQLNSRMGELLVAAKQAGNAEGRKELAAEQKKK